MLSVVDGRCAQAHRKDLGILSPSAADKGDYGKHGAAETDKYPGQTYHYESLPVRSNMTLAIPMFVVVEILVQHGKLAQRMSERQSSKR
jgi:hypothetical protein